MSTNQLYDIIVLGASTEGVAFCENLISKTEGVKVALVSRNFNHLTAKTNLTGVDLITADAVYSNYNHGLIILNLAGGTTIFSKNLVIATGSKPVKTSLKNAAIKYNISEIKANKNGQVIVYGKDNLAATYALKLAKKFKHVYLCSNSLALECDTKLINKIENVANILHLPNCNIISCKNDKEGKLIEAQLDTYSSIKCDTIIMSLGRQPEVSGISKRMIEIDTNGFVKTKAFNETTKVPNIYAIGTCTMHATSHSTTLALNHIISKNNFKLKEEK